MSSIKIISAIIVLLSLFSLCSSSSSSQNDVFTIALNGNRNDSNSKVNIDINESSKNKADLEIKAGKILTVKASVVETKGLKWVLINATEILKRKELETLNLNGSKLSEWNKINRGTYVFQFKAIAKTDIILKFALTNVAENIVQKTVELSVKII